MTVDDGSNVAVTGLALQRNQLRYYTIKFAATDGATLWEKPINGLGNVAVSVDSRGNSVVVAELWQ
jgi:hypothetical protein